MLFNKTLYNIKINSEVLLRLGPNPLTKLGDIPTPSTPILSLPLTGSSGSLFRQSHLRHTKRDSVTGTTFVLPRSPPPDPCLVEFLFNSSTRHKRKGKKGEERGSNRDKGVGL